MPCIAVLDDEASIRELLAAVFVEFGWDLLPLAEAAGAVEAIAAAQPDLILLDLRLGGLVSGWQVLQDLAMLPATRAIPVILWSGAVDEMADKREWLDAQGITVLVKPFELDELHDAVVAALAPEGTLSVERESLT